MSTDLRARFKDAEWFPNTSYDSSSITIMIGGCGGIGSWTSFFLANIGYKIIVYDFDTVEEHNLAGQLFTKSDIGEYKVVAMQKMISTTLKLTETQLKNAAATAKAGAATGKMFDNYKGSGKLYGAGMVDEQVQNQPIDDLVIH